MGKVGRKPVPKLLILKNVVQVRVGTGWRVAVLSKQILAANLMESYYYKTQIALLG